MRVEIYADVACPWCFMAKRRFEWALAVFPGRDEVDVVLRPYQLDPALPTDPGQAALAVRQRALEAETDQRALLDAAVKAAAAEGIDYQADAVIATNTMTAHRLIWLAGKEDGSAVARQVMDRIFLAYFTEGLNISDAETLTEIAMRSGMDPGRVRRFLATDEGADQVRKELEEAWAGGIRAVPTIVFGNGRVVIGAQDSLTYLDLLEELGRDTEEGVTRDDAQVSEARACA